MLTLNEKEILDSLEDIPTYKLEALVSIYSGLSDLLRDFAKGMREMGNESEFYEARLVSKKKLVSKLKKELKARKLFMNNLIDYTTDGKTWRLLSPCGIECPDVDFGKWKAYGVDEWSDTLLIEAKGNRIVVYPNYKWDGCTMVQTADWNVRASLFHDALYQAKKCGAKTAGWWAIDSIFNTIMKQDGASWLQRKIYYAGVRTFGAFWKLQRLNSLRIEEK